MNNCAQEPTQTIIITGTIYFRTFPQYLGFFMIIYSFFFFIRGCLKNMLAEPQEEGLFSAEQIREYIGESFRERIRYLIPEWYTNQEICDWLMRKQVLVHLKDNEDKFNLICYMIKKLFLVRHYNLFGIENEKFLRYFPFIF